MGIEHALLMQDMTDSQRLMFLSEFNSHAKKKSVCYLWLIFTGGLGGHHYYMGNAISGVLYTVFCWTFIPLICAFFELFIAWSYVENHNNKIANDIAYSIKCLK